nr:retrotransposon protein, putative, Ty1-copia subclass [Tanacetum cinerariifolium]
MISKKDSGSKIDLEEIQVSTDEEPIMNTNTQPEVVTLVKPDDISLPICKTSGRVSKPPQFYYGFHIEEDKISNSTLSKLDKPANYKEAMASPDAANIKMVGCKWIFKKNTDMDGKVHTYKARLIDVKTAFLNGKLTKDVFMAQPEGFENAKDRSKHLIGLSQDAYLDKILKRFKMENFKKGNLPLHHGIKISKDLRLKINKELDRMSRVPYALAVGLIMYAMTCTRPDVSFALSMVSRQHQNPGEGHLTAIKNILKYLRNNTDKFLVYGGEEELGVTGYSDASWQTDKVDSRS